MSLVTKLALALSLPMSMATLACSDDSKKDAPPPAAKASEDTRDKAPQPRHDDEHDERDGEEPRADDQVEVRGGVDLDSEEGVRGELKLEFGGSSK